MAKSGSKNEIRLKRMHQVDELPAPEDRDGDTLYLLTDRTGIGERDRVLGQFMDQWSRLEHTVIRLLCYVQGSSFQAASITFANSTGIHQIRELVTGLGRLVITDAEQKRWGKLSERLRNLQAS